MKTYNKKVSFLVSITIIVLLITLFFSTYTCPTSSRNDSKFNYYDRIQTLESQVKELQNKVIILEKNLNEEKAKINNLSNSKTETKSATEETKEIKNDNITSTEKVDKNVKSTAIQSTNTQEIETNRQEQNQNTVSLCEDESKDTEKEKQGINTDITEKSGLSSDELDQVINHVMITMYNKKNSKLIGQGKALYEMEQDNLVNSLYALAIATFETGWGCTGVSNQNNLFAFAGKKGYLEYAYVEDSISDFGSCMRSYYFDKRGLTTVSKVAPVYCPPNSVEWTYQVNWLIDFYKNIAEEILQK